MAYPEKYSRNVCELARFMLDLCHHGMAHPLGAGCPDISGSMVKIWQPYIHVVVN
jgi:hypothetical protein